jgi:serine protease inhibitor
MFLINAIYFKGNWTYKFERSRTEPLSFTSFDGTMKNVPMMFSKGVTLRYGGDEAVEVVDIPYGNGQFKFTVLMPRVSTSLTSFAKDLTPSSLEQLLADADTLTTELVMPKFSLTWKKDLKDDLGAMGMQMRGFPNLFQDPLPLEVSRVVHQSFLDVNEEGSEAAAATAIGVELTSAPVRPLRVTIDRPFLFLIREKHSGVIVFMGQVIDVPAQQ